MFRKRPAPNTTVGTAGATRELVDLGSSGWFGVRGYLRERRALLANPELAVEDPDNLVRDSSLAFALKGILIPTVAVAMLGWTLVVFAGLPAEVDEDAAMAKSLRSQRDSLGGYVAALQRDSARLAGITGQVSDAALAAITSELAAARGTRTALEPRIAEHEELADMTAFAPLEWALDNLLIPFLIIMPGLFFRGTLVSKNPEHPRFTVADRAYVYIVSARTFVPTAVILVGDFFVGVLQRYGFAGTDAAEMSVAVLWLVGGIWQLVEITRSVRPLSVALAAPWTVVWRAFLRAVAIWLLIMSLIAIGIELIPE